MTSVLLCLNEFQAYLRNEITIRPTKVEDKALIMYKFGWAKMLVILTLLGAKDQKIKAIEFVGKGNSCLQASREFDCSSATVKKWISDTYKLLLTRCNGG